MLVLSRKIGQSIEVDGPAIISILDVVGNKVRIGIEADRSVNIVRPDAKKLRTAENNG